VPQSGTRLSSSKPGEGKIVVGWHSEPIVTLPAWAPGQGSVALLQRMRTEDASLERFLSWELEEEESPRWWILSALDRCDGKEAREAYYDRV
jgi:hypothetical protein